MRPHVANCSQAKDSTISWNHIKYKVLRKVQGHKPKPRRKRQREQEDYTKHKFLREVYEYCTLSPSLSPFPMNTGPGERDGGTGGSRYSDKGELTAVPVGLVAQGWLPPSPLDDKLGAPCCGSPCARESGLPSLLQVPAHRPPYDLLCHCATPTKERKRRNSWERPVHSSAAATQQGRLPC